MAQGNHFLTIPKQEGLFTAIKSGRGEDNGDNSPVEDEDEEETEEEVRFIPRCSPVPRKRGPSITDETAEYMRIRLALQRRVSFADATGGELVDVREFAAFDSGDDENNADWEEEEAKCRRAYLEPVYRVWPEFQARDTSDLMPAVRAGKVEVEKVTPVQNQPLSFDALICVLNVSYHKRVYVRSTMDGWITCTDSVAEYVQGSHDGDTDRFSARLSFSEPYLFNGARIDFVVRYETSEGEFWANNSGRNYSVTLVVSYEEDTRQDNKVDDREIKGILKPSRFSGEDDSDFYQDTDDGNDDDDDAERETVAEIPSTMSPLIIKPEIDIEIPEVLISPSKAREDPTQAECPPQSTDSQEEHTLQDSSKNPPQSDHLEKDQGTELLIPVENKTDSIQNEAPDNDATSNSDRYSMHSVEGSHAVCPSQDSHQSDTAVQTPVVLGITIPATLSSIQDMKEVNPEELKDHIENDAIQSGQGRVTELQDQSSVKMEADSTESSLKELPESTQHLSLNEVMAASTNKGKEDFSLSTGRDILFEESHEPLLENPEFQMINLDTTVRRETNEKEQVNLKAGEVPDMIASCMHQPFEPTNLGKTREDCVIQNVPSTLRTPDPELTKHQQQGQGPEPELNKVPDVLSVSVDTPFVSESISPQELSPILIPLSSVTSSPQNLTITVQTVALGDGDGQPGSKSTIPNEATQMLTPLSSGISLSQSSTTTMQTMAYEDGDGEPSMRQDEPLSNEEFELYYHDPASFQKKGGLETQPALPCRNFEASNVEVGVILGKTLIPPFAFLSATVCLIVGFHEPSIFLIMALFLVSLCF